MPQPHELTIPTAISAQRLSKFLDKKQGASSKGDAA